MKEKKEKRCWKVRNAMSESGRKLHEYSCEEKITCYEAERTFSKV